MKSILIDAGPLIALFSIDDKHYDHYNQLVSAFSADGLRLVTTWPCVVEASYLLNNTNRFELLEWISLGGVIVYPFGPENLKEMIDPMKTYTKNDKYEMDLTDATLYWLASETRIHDIMTTDNRDFSRYRLPGGEYFQIH